MKLIDTVKIGSRFKTVLISKAGRALKRILMSDEDDPVSIKGYMKIRTIDKKGRTVQEREGSNIWTITGREFLPMLMSYQMAGVPYRRDRVTYIGLGTGGYVETASVSRLENPVEYSSGEFLAALDIPPSWPLYPTRTVCAYKKIYDYNELTFGSIDEIEITEAGLFTNGDPNPASSDPWTPGTRRTGIVYAIDQAPVAYKVFESVQKRNTFLLEVEWEIRF